MKRVLVSCCACYLLAGCATVVGQAGHVYGWQQYCWGEYKGIIQDYKTMVYVGVRADLRWMQSKHRLPLFLHVVDLPLSFVADTALLRITSLETAIAYSLLPSRDEVERRSEQQMREWEKEAREKRLEELHPP